MLLIMLALQFRELPERYRSRTLEVSFSIELILTIRLYQATQVFPRLESVSRGARTLRPQYLANDIHAPVLKTLLGNSSDNIPVQTHL